MRLTMAKVTHTTYRKRRPQYLIDNDPDIVGRRARLLSFTQSFLLVWFIISVLGITLILLDILRLDATPRNTVQPDSVKNDVDSVKKESTQHKEKNRLYYVLTGISSFLFVVIFAFTARRQRSDTPFGRKDLSIVSYILTTALVSFGIAVIIDEDIIAGIAIIVFSFFMFLIFVFIDKYFDYIGGVKGYAEDQVKYVEDQKKYVEYIKYIQEYYKAQADRMLKKIPGLGKKSPPPSFSEWLEGRKI